MRRVPFPNRSIPAKNIFAAKGAFSRGIPCKTLPKRRFLPYRINRLCLFPRFLPRKIRSRDKISDRPHPKKVSKKASDFRNPGRRDFRRIHIWFQLFYTYTQSIRFKREFLFYASKAAKAAFASFAAIEPSFAVNCQSSFFFFETHNAAEIKETAPAIAIPPPVKDEPQEDLQPPPFTTLTVIVPRLVSPSIVTETL